MVTFRRVPTIDPPPAEVISPVERARAEREVKRLADYWLLEPAEVKALLFVRGLVADGRMGKGDRN